MATSANPSRYPLGGTREGELVGTLSAMQAACAIHRWRVFYVPRESYWPLTPLDAIRASTITVKPRGFGVVVLVIAPAAERLKYTSAVKPRCFLLISCWQVLLVQLKERGSAGGGGGAPASQQQQQQQPPQQAPSAQCLRHLVAISKGGAGEPEAVYSYAEVGAVCFVCALSFMLTLVEPRYSDLGHLFLRGFYFIFML